jgi:predicted O-linked N-acetylglucosamine transferase (SPINDLY family)
MSNVGPKLEQARQLFMAGRAEQARATLARALQQRPGDPDLSNAMAMVLMSMQQHDQAVYHAQRAAAGRPDDPAILANFGSCLGILGRNAEARPPLERAVALAPRLVEARLALAGILRDQRDFSAAAEHLRAGLEVNPSDAALAALYAAVLTSLARAHEALEYARRALAVAPDPPMATMLANASNYDPECSPAEILEAHRAFGRIIAPTLPPPAPHANSRDAERPLRIGVLSAELRRHSVAYFLEPLFEHIDRASLAITAYSTGGEEDAVSRRLKPMVLRWAEVSRLDDDTLAARIRADQIDILIETSGYTRGHRLAVMARRPAPVQVTFCGYPNTTGLSAIDYRVVDSLTDPPRGTGYQPATPGDPRPSLDGEYSADDFVTEKLVRLDPCFLCFKPHGQRPERPAGAAAAPIFGSFNATMKINDPLLALWARVLDQSPGSRLLLKAYGLHDSKLGEDLRRRFKEQGGDPARLEVLGAVEDPGGHLAVYNRVDVALDSFPYHGTTTTCEALSMGVPVVTLVGRTHASRVGLSLLSAVGLTDLCATTPDEYVSLAAALGRDTPRRADLRTTLPDRLAASPLCDGPAYARRFGEALRTMWRTWCANPR